MMKLKTFAGGLHFPDNKQWSAQKAIEECPLPSQLHIPLSQHIGLPAEPCVKTGDLIKKGQPIGRAKGLVSVPVHASTSGEVVAVEPRPHPSGRNLPTVVMVPDGADEWHETISPARFEDLSPDQIRERIREAGVVGMGGATFPTHVKLSPPAEKPIDTLILNGVECEPYLTVDHRLMIENPQRILAGAAILRKVLGVSRVFLGIEGNKPDAIAAMTQLCAGTGIEIVALKVKFPQGAEKQLIKAITGREVPSGGLPMDVGLVVQNVGTAAAVHDAVCLGRPLIERICTIAGPGVVEPKNLRVRIGTPFSHLLANCGGLSGDPAKIVMGGPMMGMTQLSLDIPVTRGTSGVLLFRETDLALRPESPCIRCGRCVRVCPAHLLPTTIARYARLERTAEAQDYGVMDCIECGCCTYICPAAIPLVQSIRSGKAAILAKRRNI